MLVSARALASIRSLITMIMVCFTGLYCFSFHWPPTILLTTKLAMRTSLHFSFRGVLFFCDVRLTCKTAGVFELPQTATRRYCDLCQPKSCDAPKRVLPSVVYPGSPMKTHLMGPEVANMLSSDHVSCGSFLPEETFLALAGSAWIARV